MRRWRRRGGSRKRTVSWIDSITTFAAATPDNTRLIGLTNAGFPANVFGATIGVVIASDLPKHGGEDAVLTRIVGRLGFMEGRRDAGAGPAAAGFPIRVVFAQVASNAVGIFTDDFTTSSGLANDKILLCRDTVVPGTAIGGAGAGFELNVGQLTGWLDIDIKVKRKVTEDMQIILWFQTVLPAGTVGADFRLLGSLRTLLMRPR